MPPRLASSKAMWKGISERFKARHEKDENSSKMPDENSNTVSSLSDFDVTCLSEEEMSALQEVFERQWVLHEANAEEKRKLDREIKEMEAKITQRSPRGLSRKAFSELCSICFRVKVASTKALICRVCGKKTCTRCGKSKEGSWRCALCMKKRERLKFTGAWYNDLELHERSQVQEMLNRLAEESIRRMEMETYNTQEQETITISTPPDNPPRLNYFPITQNTPQVTKRVHVKTGDDDRMEDYDDDDDVFEDDIDGSDNYLNFPHDEEQGRQDGLNDSYSSVHYSSLEEESTNFADESQGASGWTNEDRYRSSSEGSRSGDQSPRRKVAVSIQSKQRNCPLIHKVALRRNPKMSGGFGSGAEFGIKVVGGRMTTGGFIGVYVARVMTGTSVEQCIKEGDQILEWNHNSMVDVTFEKVRRIVTDSPPEITLVVCHNAASFIQTTRYTSKKGISIAMQGKRKRKRYESIKCWSRWSLAQLIENDGALDETETQTQAEIKIGQIQLHLWHDTHGNNLIIRVLNARGLSLQDMPNQELPNLYVLLYLLPNREISSHFRTNTDPETVTPKWDLSFVFSNIPESELASRTLEVTLWSENKTKRNVFLGEVLIKLTPECLCSGAQWFDLVDHDEFSSFLPVPMPRRHTLSPRPKKEGNSFQWDVASRVKKSSSSCCRFAHLSLSTVNIPVSNLSSTALDYGKGNIALHHRKRRRVDSVVTMEAFRPRKQTDFFIRQSFQRKYLECHKSNSAPVTPATSIPASLEDLRQKRIFAKSTDILKLAFSPAEHFSQLKLMRDSSNDQELEVKGEREGKFKGALRAMKRYPSNLRIRLGKLHEKQPVGEAGIREACQSMAKFASGYKSLPATPSISKSTEDIRRERSFTNYLQVPPSPGVFPGLVKRSPDLTPPVLEDEELRQHFSFSKPSLKAQLSNVAEQEASQKEYSVCNASEEQCEAVTMVTASSESQPVEISCLPLENVEQESFLEELTKNRGAGVVLVENVETESSSNATDERQIPQIVIYHSSTPNDDMSQLGRNDTEQNYPEATAAAEPPVEKKGAMHALRKYSKALSRSPSLKSSERLHLFGEDPAKGVTGPGQMRKGSLYQGQEIGYLRIGLLAIRGTLEVEIIRGIIMILPGDHPPDTYVKTYLIKEHIRLLKRKTSMTRQSVNPVYNCKIKYPGDDLHNKELLVSIWCKQGIFGRKVLLGEVRIALGSLNLSVKQVSWYKLFIDSQLSE